MTGKSCVLGFGPSRQVSPVSDLSKERVEELIKVHRVFEEMAKGPNSEANDHDTIIALRELLNLREEKRVLERALELAGSAVVLKHNALNRMAPKDAQLPPPTRAMWIQTWIGEAQAAEIAKEAGDGRL